MKVNATVDVGVAEVVSLLNQIPGLQTLDSCQGDPGGRDAHVHFYMGDSDRLAGFLFGEVEPLLRGRVRDYSVKVEIFNGSEPMGTLRFSAEAIPVVASALRSLVQ